MRKIIPGAAVLIVFFLSDARGATPISYLDARALGCYDITPAGFTVECWIRVRSKPGFDPRIIRCNDPDPGPCGYPSSCWELAICNLSDCAPGHVSFSIQARGECRWIFADARVDDGRYHHVAGVYDGVFLRVFVDGREAGAEKVGFLNAPVGRGVLVVAASPDHHNPFDGAIDELRIWASARTAKQIKESMLRNITETPADLVAYWPLDGDGTDRSRNRNGLRPHNYVSFTRGKIGQAVDVMNVDALRGALERRD